MPRGRPRKNTNMNQVTDGPDLPKIIDSPTISTQETPVYSKRKRNSEGLLENVSYVFNEDGTVNWLAMIPKEYFVVNRQTTTETDVSKVEDKNKLILLAGFKKVAQLRGFTDITTEVHRTADDYVAMTTYIQWIPNYETGYSYVRNNGHADAHAGNVSTKKAPNGFVATNFLMTIAENRAFVRAVKNFLQISVLGQDEVSSANEEETSPSTTIPESEISNEARQILQKLLNDNNISFEAFKNAMNRYVSQEEIKNLNTEDWESIEQIPTERLFEITSFLKKRLEDKKRVKK